MAYNKQIYTRILREYEILQENQRKLLEQRKEEIYAKIPRIKEIDHELHTTGLALTRNIIEKNENADKIIERMKQKNIDLNMEKGELLALNHYPVDYLTIKYHCNHCKDTGFINSEKCQCFKQKLIKEAYALSNLDSILDTQNFDNFDFSYYSSNIDPDEGISPKQNMQKIFQACIDFVNNFDSTNLNLLLYGGTGLGKTFLSSCIAKDILDKGKTVFYQSAFKIFHLLEDYQFNRGDQALNQEQANILFDVDLLIIDDLGSEFVNTYTSSAFFNIINSRLLTNQKTIISTNLNMEELTNLYTERIISRIIGNYIPLKFFGEDIRKLK